MLSAEGQNTVPSPRMVMKKHLGWLPSAGERGTAFVPHEKTAQVIRHGIPMLPLRQSQDNKMYHVQSLLTEKSVL